MGTTNMAVKLLLLAVAIAAAAALPSIIQPDGSYCIHQESVNGTMKCYEACSTEGKFKSTGLDGHGPCPIHYNTVDQTKTIRQCPDGVTNIKYCASTALNVTMKVKGEAGVCLHNEDATDHRCYEACAFSKFAMKGFSKEGFCPDKYNFAEKKSKTGQCPDGVTNIKYCQDTAVDIVLRTLGEK